MWRRFRVLSWRRILRRAQDERDLEDEIQFDLSEETRLRIERGEPPALARAAVRREFGSVAAVKEDARAVWGWTFLESLNQDLRYACRVLRKNSAFSLTVVLTLAMGIGANTAIFTVVHAVLLKPLAYPDPDRLVRITGGATAARFESIRQGQSFTGVAAFTVYTETVPHSGADGPEPLKGSLAWIPMQPPQLTVAAPDNSSGLGRCGQSSSGSVIDFTKL